MTKRLIYILLLLLLVADLGFSFVQYYTTPLDGDMAGGIVPAVSVREVLASPLGMDAILNNRIYENPNKFVCHWTFKSYFSTVPFGLQHWLNPIESVYLACALAKLLIHAGLLLLLAMVVSGTRHVFKTRFIAAALLITPLFQTNGYRIYMGIIDPAVTYVFFYALPCILVLLYFLPLFLKLYHGIDISSRLVKILWIPLALIVCLSGPLNPGIVLIVSMLLMFANLSSSFRDSGSAGFKSKLIDSIRLVPKAYWFYLVPVSLFALYSLFLGRYNYINIVNEISLAEMYMRLPSGIYYLLSQKPGMPLLLLVIFGNMIFIRLKYRSDEGWKILRAFRWIGVFALIYILLLPLGGYRDYRSNILRYDTIMPITLALFFIFAASTLFLLQNVAKKQRYWYFPLTVLILLIYTNADRGQFDRNACEKTALQEIAASKDSVVHLKADCPVLSWEKTAKPEDSELNAELLQFWKVTDRKRLYYQD